MIATRNRAESLRRTLESLRSQQLRGLTWQIVVVDNGSSDGTPAVLAEATEALPLTVLVEPEPGKNRALNSAMAAARGDLLVFTDDDVVAEPDWIVAMVEATRRWPDVNIFGGSITPAFPPGTPEWLRRKEFPHGRWAFSSYGPRPDEGPTRETPLGPNMAIRARRMRGVHWDEEIGPRGPSFAMGSEVELLMRLQRQGELFIFVPYAKVRHMLPPEHVEHANLKGRAFRCGRGNARLFSRGTSRYPFFGIPIHLWFMLAKAAVRRVAATLGSDQRRALSELEFMQALGHVREVGRMRRNGEIEGQARLFPTLEALRRAARKVVQRTTAILGGVLAPYSSLQIFSVTLAADGVDDIGASRGVELYSGTDALPNVLRAVAGFPYVDPRQVEQRLRLGDTVAIAREGEQVVGYAWAATRALPLQEAGCTITPVQGEVIGYDIFVAPSKRRTGVAVMLDRVQIRSAFERGLESQLTWVASRNHRSLAAVRHMGKRRIGTINVVRLPLFRFVARWGSDAAIQSRLGSN